LTQPARRAVGVVIWQSVAAPVLKCDPVGVFSDMEFELQTLKEYSDAALLAETSSEVASFLAKGW
jgi:hypothetical protein